MGNLPMEILKYVGADYEASKDLYYSKYKSLYAPKWVSSVSPTESLLTQKTNTDWRGWRV